MLNNIFGSGWTDTVFAGRNQAYGAYKLRQLSNKAVLLACFISTGMFTGAASYSFYRAKQPIFTKDISFHEAEHTFLTPPPIDVPEIDINIAPPPPPPAVQTQGWTVPVIVEDFQEIPDEILDQATLNDMHTGGANIEGNDLLVSTVPDILVTLGDDKPTEPAFFLVVEQMPEFPGGEKELLKFVADNTVYPQICSENGVEEMIYVSFIINEQGQVTNAEIARGKDKYLKKESIRVVESMPNWKPGKQNGKNVKVKYTIPINYKTANR